MLEGLVTRAQRSVDTLISKYVTRLAVAVPFVVAIGFGTAAASVKLTEEFGSTGAHAILASAFAGFGLLAALVIAMRGTVNVGAPASNADNSEQSANADSTAKSDGALTPEFLLTVLGAAGPAALAPILRLVLRNLPVVLLVVILGYVLFSERKPGDVVADS